mmetsp:Transcript_20855/g.43676  ORF Transcript_20855/g.43676 Transcript_20855/m.43676 type:complete len:235 (-) Transcript_20855:168-872(-)
MTKHPFCSMVRVGTIGTFISPSSTTDDDDSSRAARAAAAADIPLMVACKIFTSSMKGASITATAHRTSPDLIISSYKRSRASSLVIFLLSVIPSMLTGTIAAAATTGPARGPRPASSIPMTKRTVFSVEDKMFVSSVRGRHHVSPSFAVVGFFAEEVDGFRCFLFLTLLGGVSEDSGFEPASVASVRSLGLRRLTMKAPARIGEATMVVGDTEGSRQSTGTGASRSRSKRKKKK